MSAATDYLETAIIDHFFRNEPVTSPTSLELALYTTAIDEDGDGTEVTGGSYVRMPITFAVDVDGVTSNTALVEFDDMPACVVVAGAVFAGANMLTKNSFSSPRSVTAGATFKVPPGEVIVTVR